MWTLRGACSSDSEFEPEEESFVVERRGRFLVDSEGLSESREECEEADLGAGRFGVMIERKKRLKLRVQSWKGMDPCQTSLEGLLEDHGACAAPYLNETG